MKYSCSKYSFSVRLLALVLVMLLTTTCSLSEIGDCFQNTGAIIKEEISLPVFDKITVFENITVVIKQGDTQKVEIQTGKNLRKQVSATVTDQRLELKDTNDCNYLREYGTTVIYITTPNITEIRSSTGFPISSDGVLEFDRLGLFSESFNVPEAGTTVGAFMLALQVNNLFIVTNGAAYFKVSGQANNVSINVAAGDSRIEAQNLSATSIDINHRGSNDVLISPEEQLKGVIRSTGNVQCYTQPAIVHIEELFNGRLIYVQ